MRIPRSSNHSNAHARRVYARQLAVEHLEERHVLASGLLISEFMAANDNTLLDIDGESSDWIEVHNPTATAVDLGNWHLTDDETDLAKWTFPAISLDAGEFMVLFASGKDRANPVEELHTNFNLSANGEYLALVEPDLTVAHAYAPYPAQVEDVSFGVIFDGFQFVTDGSPVEYHVPADSSLGTDWTDTAFIIDEESWADGESGIGFGLSVPGFSVTYYKSTSTVGNLSDAESVVANSNLQASAASETVSVINYLDTGDGAHYGNDNPFPSVNIGSNVDDFVIEAVATVLIPSSGPWTFGVNSDDGFELELTNGTSSFSTSFPNPRGPGDTLQTFNVPQPGPYDMRLIMYERGGGAEVELFAAQGSFSSWNGTNFDLVGDAANGGLDVFTAVDGGGGAAGSYRTDIETAMKGVNPSVYVRAPFTVTDPTELDSLSLEIQYNDGFIGYLNGTEIASRNAPAVAAWNSSATTNRSLEDTFMPEVINLTSSLGLLTTGTNILSLHGLNVTTNNDDFLLAPHVVGGGALASDPLFFAAPTPGTINSEESFGVVADTKFSVNRGFYEVPFQVDITTTTPDATIRYTTDGSEPTSTSGTIYTGPITIANTTTLRAAAFKPGFQATNVDTQTYVFVADIVNQTNSPPGFPSSWGPEPADYQMDPDITGNPLFNDSFEDDLRSLPVMSITLDQADMFGSGGIYSNPNNQGAAWERPASIEYFSPDSSEQFQENAGIRMYGGVGRNANYKKHSFRLLFKSQYGDTKLRFPLFGDEAVDRFDTIILRSNFNDAWVWGGSETQYVRDEFLGRMQNAMGEPGRHGIFVHLYINGLYWGLYNPVERPDTSFSASYFGGDKANWDGINSGSPTGESQTAAWNTLMSLSSGLGSDSGYQQVQGNNLDGTNNPAQQDYLDIDNYITYLLLNFWAGNNDWVTHNWYAGRERGPNSTGFKAYSWDAEWTMDLRSGLNDNGVNDTTTDNHLLKPYTYLRNNAEFRLRFADQVQQHFFNNGALTPNSTLALYQTLADEIEAAIVAESARWGDVARSNPYTPTDWTSERDYVLNTYLPQRTGIVLQQLRSAGLYPNVDAPTLAINGASQHGGQIQVGDSLSINGSGAIYYTTDGSDPRKLYGGVSSNAEVYTSAISLNEPVQILARVLNNGTWSALTNATYLLETPPPIRITEIMYNPAAADVAAGELNVDNDLFEYIEIQNVGSQTLDISDLQFTSGVDFGFAESSVTNLGAGDYAVVVRDIAAFQSRYGAGTNIAGEFANDTRLSNGGERLRLESAIGQVYHDFSYSDGWYPQTDGAGFSLVVLDPSGPLGDWSEPSGWRATENLNGSPGTTDSGLIPGTIVINELLSHTDDTSGDWLELLNTSDSPVDIGGWFLSDDPSDLTKYQIAAGTTLNAGEFAVFTQAENFGNPMDPGTNIAFGFSELGDEAIVTSLDPTTGGPGGYREDVAYAAAEKEFTFGRLVNSAGYVDFVSLATKTQGTANAAAIVPPVVVNEIMYNPALPDTSDDEYVELYNRSSDSVPLFDPDIPANTWRFTNGVDFEFPQNITLAAGEYVLVVPIDPVVFSNNHTNLPAGVRIFGPYTGSLDNAGEVLELSRPGEPDPGPGEVPFIVNERVRFNDKSPWPFTPDGQGPSLSRVDDGAWGNEPAHWSAGTNGGTPGRSNLFTDSTPPTLPTNLALSVDANGLLQITWDAAVDLESGVSSYRVFRDSAAIGTSTGTSITDASVNFDISHSYTVSAINGDGIESGQSTSVSTQVTSFQDGAFPNGSYAGTADTELRGADPTSNQGSDTNLEIDGDDGGSDLWVLMKWELFTIPANATLLGASITMNVSNQSGGSYEAYEMKRDWAESQATWQQYRAGQSWQTDGGQGGNDRGSEALGTMNFNSTGLRTFNLNGDGIQLLQDWLLGSKPNNGFIFGNTSTTDGLDFNSREVASASNRPKLSVSYIVGTENDPPTIANQSFSTIENRPTGEIVGIIVASDPNAGDNLTLDVTGGTGVGAFAVNATTGAITVTNSALVNHESAASATLNVRVTDPGGLTDSAVVTIQINDVNEAPSLSPQSLDIDEDATNGVLVGTIAASDPDADEDLSYQLISGTGVGVFGVASSGAVTVLDANSLSGGSSLTLTVRVTDSGNLTDTQTYTVDVNEVNQPPVLIPQTLDVDENTSNGQLVGTITANDPDIGETFTFQLLSGTGMGVFDVASNGDVTVFDVGRLNYEVDMSYTLFVRVSDGGGLTDTRTFTVQVNDVNEPPVLSIPLLDVAEHSSAGTVVGVLGVNDPDAGDTRRFDIIGGTGATAFAVNGDGTIVVSDPSQLDFEMTNALTLTVRVTDVDGLIDTQTFSVSITDVMESAADFDANDVLNCADVNALVQHIAAGSHDPAYDLTGDLSIDRDDLREWLAVAGAENLPDSRAYSGGDANLDGAVDAQDFGIWSANRFTVLPEFCAGDLNADGLVDVRDFNIWNDEGFVAAPAEAAAAQRPPRPADSATIIIMAVNPSPQPELDLENIVGFVAADAETRPGALADDLPVDHVFRRYTCRSEAAKRPSHGKPDGKLLDELFKFEFELLGQA